MPVQFRCAPVCLRVVISLVLLILPLTTSWAQKATDPGVPSTRKPTEEEKRNEQSEARAAGTPDNLIQLNTALEGLAEKVSQGVVQILVTGYGTVEEGGRQETALITRQRAIGSGVVVDPSGYVMTNAHVVDGARRIRVVLPVPSVEGGTLEPEGKRRILEAKLVGVHQESDLALLKVSAKELPALPLETSRRVHQGQLVFAIGSP